VPADVELRRGQQQARVSPVGGRVLSYVVAGKEVLAGEEPADLQAYRSALLAPWPNRIADGRWTWDGEELQVPVNETAVGAALHGLVAYADFGVVAAADDAVQLAHDLDPTPGYPFSLRIEPEYRLSDEGLVCSLVARNTGDRPAPVGLGVHPYLDCRGPVDDVELMLPAETLVLGDDAWRETGRSPVADTDLDFRLPRRVGHGAIDACWTDVARDDDGRVRAAVRFPDGDSVEVWGGSTCRWLVAYNGDTLPVPLWRRSIAVEPCTCPANAFQSGTDLEVVDPGQTLVLEWGLRPSW